MKIYKYYGRSNENNRKNYKRVFEILLRRMERSTDLLDSHHPVLSLRWVQCGALGVWNIDPANSVFPPGDLCCDHVCRPLCDRKTIYFLHQAGAFDQPQSPQRSDV